MTHGLRALHDAICVGIGTVISDDPSLTVRYATGSHPRPVLVDRCGALVRNIPHPRKHLPIAWAFSHAFACKQHTSMSAGLQAFETFHETYYCVQSSIGAEGKVS